MGVNRNKGTIIPLKISLIIMFFTLFVYIWGPIRWIEEWNISEVETIVFLILCFLFFAFGYTTRIRSAKDNRQSIMAEEGDIDRWLRVLRISIHINLILTIANAFLYAGVSSIPSLLDKMLVGLTTPNTVYYGKDASSRAGSIVVWITFFYSPIMYITSVMSLYIFKRLKGIQKIAVIVTLLVEVSRWLAVGTNKGLFDVVLLFVSIYLVRRVRFYSSIHERTVANRRKNRRMLLFVIIIGVAFFSFFGTAISARVGGKYATENYEVFPYSMIPEGLRFFIDKFDSYLCQGYDNLEKIIEHCTFKWTYGVGNSRFLLNVVDSLFHTNITSRTYPYQLGNFGVNPLASWHSAYAWFASDLSFFGVIPFMFFVGFFFAGLTDNIMRYEDPISITLFYHMILALFNASCTNSVLAYTNGFSGFWVLYFVYFLKQKRVVITIGHKRIAFNRENAEID